MAVPPPPGGGKHCKSLEGNVLRKVVSTSKEEAILGRDRQFFAVVLSRMDLGGVDAWRMWVFVWMAVKYVIKTTDNLPYLREVYCEIYIEQNI